MLPTQETDCDLEGELESLEAPVADQTGCRQIAWVYLPSKERSRAGGLGAAAGGRDRSVGAGRAVCACSAPPHSVLLHPQPLAEPKEGVYQRLDKRSPKMQV